MHRSSRIHVVYGTLIAAPCCVIGFLAWQLVGYSMMYRRNVDYCSELAFAYGYAFGRGLDIERAHADFHHRLTRYEYEDGVLSVEVWPAKKQWLKFHNPRHAGEDRGMVDCSVSP